MTSDAYVKYRDSSAVAILSSSQCRCPRVVSNFALQRLSLNVFSVLLISVSHIFLHPIDVRRHRHSISVSTISRETAMITRKRGRSSLNADITCSSTSHEIDDDDDSKTSNASEMNIQTSPESDTNDWGLDDLLGSEFNWDLDNEVLDAFVNLESQTTTSDGADQSAVLDIPTSRSRSAVQRSKLQDVSGRLINKNAIAARINRLKKKEYVSGLEQRVGSLTTENRVLKQENGNLNKRVEELENETRYLRAVLANESMLAQLLSRLSGVNGMKFSTSLFQESNENDHDYAMPRKRVKVEDKETAGGVCLHVDKDHVSVEFCTKCAESSSLSHKM